MHEEVWQDAPGYEGLYQVSKSGLVRSLLRGTPRLIRPWTNGPRNYLQVQLTKDGKNKKYLLHRLVMMTFSPVENAQHRVVNHKDMNTHNCAFDNLEWESWGGNITHYREHFDKDQRIAALEAWIDQQGARNSTCACSILERKCMHCGSDSSGAGNQI